MVVFPDPDYLVGNQRANPSSATVASAGDRSGDDHVFERLSKYTEYFTVKHRITFCFFALVLAFAGAGAAWAQTFDVRVVQVLPNPPIVDVFVNDISTAIITDLAYEYTTPVARLPVGTGSLNIKVAPKGAGIGGSIINENVSVASTSEYTAVVYPRSGGRALKMLDRLRSRVPAGGKSLFRVFNATTFADPPALDLYLDSLAGTPVFSALAPEAATAIVDVKGEPKTLYITAAGTKTAIAQLVVPFVTSGRMTLILTGASKDDLKVFALSGENQDGHRLPALEGAQGGMLSSVRVVHAWYQPRLQGSGVQPLDIFLNGNQEAKTAGLNYRNASEKYGPLVEDTATVAFAPVNEGLGSAVLQQKIRLNRDTDYVAILTRSKEGAAAALTLGAPNTIPGDKADSMFVRAAYVTDYHKDVVVKITPTGLSAIDLPPVRFLTSTDWYTIPRGGFKVEAFAYSDPKPFYTKVDDGNYPTTYLTVIVLGSESTFEIDILNESLPVRQEFDPSASVPVVPGIRALELAAVPNPASGVAMITYDLPSAAHGTLTLHDALGRTVATLVDGIIPAGPGHADLNTASLAPGVYTVRLHAGNLAVGTGRLVVVR